MNEEIKSDIQKRRDTLLWWNHLTLNMQTELCYRYYRGRIYTTLTGREIELIYCKTQTPQP